VIDIRNDSLYCTNYQENIDKKKHPSGNDTFRIHPSEIKKIRTTSWGPFSSLGTYEVARYKYFFDKDNEAKGFKHSVKTVYSADSSASVDYDVVPYLSGDDVTLQYQQIRISHYFTGLEAKACDNPDNKNFVPKVKKGVWFTPTAANIIKGVNIGIQTMNVNDEPLAIQGVNLNIDMFTFFYAFGYLFDVPSNNALINMPDSVDKSAMQNRVKGFSASFGGLAGDMQVSGVSFNAGFCKVTESKGVVVSGSQNLVDEFHGMEITALRNKAVKGRGVQLGLLNICKDFKGIQIGLWNVNSKRRLPIINWNFRSASKTRQT